MSGTVSTVPEATQRTPNGAVPSSATGVLVAAPTRLLSVKIRYGGTGANFLMLFDAAAVADIATGRLILGSGYPVSAASRDVVVEFAYDVPCAFGAAYGVSSSPTAYVAVAQAASVAAQWR